MFTVLDHKWGCTDKQHKLNKVDYFSFFILVLNLDAKILLQLRFRLLCGLLDLSITYFARLVSAAVRNIICWLTSL